MLLKTRVARLRDKGLSNIEIAAKLNELGLRKRSGKEYTNSDVSSALSGSFESKKTSMVTIPVPEPRKICVVIGSIEEVSEVIHKFLGAA